MKSATIVAVLSSLALVACAPHPSHPIVYPPPQPPQVGERPEVIPPHPAHPIVYPHSELYILLHGYSIKDVWANTPCETATDGSEWCGHIPVPHVEHY